MASEWQTAFVSHKMPWCALLVAAKNYNKTLEKLQDSILQDQDQDFMIQDKDQDQDFHFCPRGASRPITLVSRTEDYITDYAYM